jgi:hypothetical protein
MPTSKHRKGHKDKKNARKRELELKRHRTQVFAQKVNEAVKAYQEQEAEQTGLTSLPSMEINLDNDNII